MPIYSRTLTKARVAAQLTGTIPDTTINVLLNKAVTDVLDELDLRSTKRKTALTPNLFTDVFQYTCPTDLKGMKIVDIMPQVNRSKFDDWRLTTREEFDRLKQSNRLTSAGELVDVTDRLWMGESLVAFADNDMVRKLLISRPVDDLGITIDSMDSSTGWTAVGDATNIVADNSNYVNGCASVKFDIGSGGVTTAGIYKDLTVAVNLTNYLTEGSLFVWAYIASTTYLTNFILRVGSSSSAYYQMTATTTSEGLAFQAGWNLIRFSMSGKATTGVPDYENTDYVSLYMTKNALKVSEVGYRFDNLVARRGVYYDVVYYSKYLWQSAAGAYLENSTADTDYLNVDTDELKLIENKYIELAERYIGSGKEGTAQSDYKNSIASHQTKYPSEAILLSTQYYNVYFP